ncbi:hypothetical protein C9I92_20990 [Photobacterium ganghwense]|uniref:Uncharacterized protein n=1 Tax=Photobacterium ganghwense TaxID=320778 RepID=A0A0J1H0I8_9GAMM|nr:hypothetical protein ABT57_22030 [Photobacterium ganghwense]PSU05753.1 hypothetical protein C9I92_20990 [Photobacterium ganghwense]
MFPPSVETGWAKVIVQLWHGVGAMVSIEAGALRRNCKSEEYRKLLRFSWLQRVMWFFCLLADQI